MELRQLRYFLAVADARSFVSAAEKLFVSRQAISKSVSQLEEELKVSLFMRDSNGAFLTPAGVMFYERIHTLVTELDSVRSQMLSYGARYHQRIRIAFSVGTVQLLEQQLLDYRDKQHNADISYEEQPEELCRQLLMEHKADVIVTTGRLQDPLFITRQIISSPFGILIREQKELHSVEPSDLSWIPLAGQDDSQTKAFCHENSVSLRYRGHDTGRLLELTRAGKCAMVLPRCLIPNNLEGLQWVSLEKDCRWQLYVSYPRNTDRNLMFSAAVEDMYKRVFSSIAAGEETRI